jgi:hypothetical protein
LETVKLAPSARIRALLVAPAVVDNTMPAPRIGDQRSVVDDGQRAAGADLNPRPAR